MPNFNLSTDYTLPETPAPTIIEPHSNKGKHSLGRHQQGEHSDGSNKNSRTHSNRRNKNTHEYYEHDKNGEEIITNSPYNVNSNGNNYRNSNNDSSFKSRNRKEGEYGQRSDSKMSNPRTTQTTYVSWTPKNSATLTINHSSLIVQNFSKFCLPFITIPNFVQFSLFYFSFHIWVI